MTTRTITCFGDWTNSTSLIIASVSQTKITRSPTISSRVLSYRKSKLCKKKRINIWICRSPYLQWRPSWVRAHAQFYQVTLWLQNIIPLMHHDHLAGNRYSVPFFVFYTESVMLGPRLYLST